MIQHLRTLFLTQSAITNVVGDRIYCEREPQSPQYPLILITDMSTDPMVTLAGTGGMQSSKMDIDCKNLSLSAASSLGQVVRDFFADYVGAAGSVTVKSVVLQDDSLQSESQRAGQDVVVYTRLLDVEVNLA